MFLKYVLILSAVLLCSAQKAENAKAAPEVVCYVGTWAAYRTGPATYDTTMIDPFACTKLIYSFFGITAEGEIRLTDPWLDLPDGGGKDTIRKFNALKEKNPELKTLAAIGGWNEGSTNFSIVAASPDLRKKFAQSTLEFVRKNNFNGADIDWEYPMRRNDLKNNDTLNFNLLLEELKKAFAPHKLLLTIAVSATKTVASEIYDISGMAEQVDGIHVMAYDLALGTDAQTGFNAPYYPPQGQTNELNVDAIVKYWTSVAPANKLILGIPFYGHSFTLKNATENDPGSPSTGPGPAGPYSQEAGTLTYLELCLQWKAAKWTRIFDGVQKVPYTYLDNVWVSFDSAESIILKGNLAMKNGWAGVMSWSLESDDNNDSCGDGKSPLLKALNKGVNRVIPTKAAEAKAPVAKAPVAKASEAKAPVPKAPVPKPPVAKAPEAKAKSHENNIEDDLTLEETRNYLQKIWQQLSSMLPSFG